MKIIDNIVRKWTHIRLQPIHVYDLHHVCEQYDAASMHKEDWMALNEFQLKVRAMQRSGVTFISLTEAYRLLLLASSPFAFRLKRYAVLTFDDGYASLKEVLLWLEKQGIPCTLFINGKYTDGVSYRENPKEKYLTIEDLQDIVSHKLYTLNHKPSIELSSHGWEHTDARKMTTEEFAESVDKNLALLSPLTASHTPLFHAYTWGNHTAETDQYLQFKNIIPVYVDGMRNYNDAQCMHRELFK